MTTTFNGGHHGGVDFTGVEDFTVMTNQGGGNGSNSVDDITTGDGDDFVWTFESNDLIHVGKGTDTVDGGAGYDGLQKEFNLTDAGINIDLDASTFSGPGSFVNLEYFIELKATNNADVIVTGLTNNSGSAIGDDTIYTFGGDDVVTLRNDDDTVDMGSGNDRLILDYSNSTFQGNTSLTISGSGSYSGTFTSTFSSGATVNFSNVESFTIYTNNGGGNGSNSVDNLTTGNGNDIIYTYQSNDVVNSGGGNDYHRRRHRERRGQRRRGQRHGPWWRRQRHT